MALIHRTASAGSPEKSAGRAPLSSVVLVDMGVTGVTGGAGGVRDCLGGAGGTALCLGGLGVWGVDGEGAMVKGSGEEGRSSLSLGSHSP